MPASAAARLLAAASLATLGAAALLLPACASSGEAAPSPGLASWPLEDVPLTGGAVLQIRRPPVWTLESRGGLQPDMADVRLVGPGALGVSLRVTILGRPPGFDLPPDALRAKVDVLAEAAAQPYVSGSIEGAVNLVHLPVRHGAAAYATFTDAALAHIPAEKGKFRVVSAGVLVRDGWLVGFSIFDYYTRSPAFDMALDVLGTIVPPEAADASAHPARCVSTPLAEHDGEAPKLLAIESEVDGYLLVLPYAADWDVACGPGVTLAVGRREMANLGGDAFMLAATRRPTCDLDFVDEHLKDGLKAAKKAAEAAGAAADDGEVYEVTDGARSMWAAHQHRVEAREGRTTRDVQVYTKVLALPDGGCIDVEVSIVGGKADPEPRAEFAHAVLGAFVLRPAAAAPEAAPATSTP